MATRILADRSRFVRRRDIRLSRPLGPDRPLFIPSARRLFLGNILRGIVRLLRCTMVVPRQEAPPRPPIAGLQRITAPLTVPCVLLAVRRLHRGGASVFRRRFAEEGVDGGQRGGDKGDARFDGADQGEEREVP